jgi:hypothetical protein
MNTASRLQESFGRFLCACGWTPEKAIEAAAESFGEDPIALRPTRLEESTARVLEAWAHIPLAEGRRLVRAAHPEGAFIQDVAQPRPASQKSHFIQESAHVELIAESNCGHVTTEVW